MLYSYSCGSQVKAQTSSGHIFHVRSCVRRHYPSEAVKIVSYCTKRGRMSRKLGIVEITFHHQVMSGDILRQTLTTFKIIYITLAVGHFF